MWADAGGSFSSVDTIWVLVAAALVFFMQAGFAMVETGFTRAKNAGNIIMKNMIDLSIGTVAFWVFGFGLMFGGTSALFGGFDFFIRGDYGGGYPTAAFVIFQTVFCATAATIVSGGMAERTKFSSYLIYSLVISALIYPISGHWIWDSAGWLAKLGFHDFAGSTAVHMVGGVSALIGAKMVGPRIGKYFKNKATGKTEVRAIPGHSVTLGALGVFILWFCWFGFNGGSTVSMTDGSIFTASSAFVTTNMAAGVGALGVLFITWIKYKKPDVSMTLNGALGGLVAVTAGANTVSVAGALFIGLIAAFVIVFGVEFIDKKLKIDDPVGAVGVHALCGAVGTILVGFFSVEKGIFYNGFGGESWKFLGVQILGVVSVAAWVILTVTLLFFILKKTIGLRVSPAHELMGLDRSEHGLASGYADFMPSGDSVLGISEGISLSEAENKYEENRTAKQHVAVIDHREEPDNGKKKHKMTKIVVITSHNKFDILKNALDKLGITGMTVTNVMGCGMQRGGKEFYRGVAVESSLLPKIKVEIVVSKVPVKSVIEIAKKALYTGNIGDGKIFIYDVENVVKIRTGEEGYDALQDAV